MRAMAAALGGSLNFRVKHLKIAGVPWYQVVPSRGAVCADIVVAIRDRVFRLELTFSQFETSEFSPPRPALHVMSRTTVQAWVHVDASALLCARSLAVSRSRSRRDEEQAWRSERSHSLTHRSSALISRACVSCVSLLSLYSPSYGTLYV